MAVMSENDRNIVRQVFSQNLSDEREACTHNKSDLKTLVDATDTWISDNQGSYNSALNTALPGNTLTQTQKVRLFLKVAERRFEVDA